MIAIIRYSSSSCQICLDSKKSSEEYSFYNRFPQIEDPVKYPRDFDRRRVKGLVVNLISVTRMDYVAAIEKAAGGKLYQLVVDTSDTAEYLISNKLLKKRTTIIPLDNINCGRPLDHRIVQKAKQLVGNQDAEDAKNCVSIAPEFASVLDYCFNGVLVAKTNTQAHDLCFNRDIMSKVSSDQNRGRHRIKLQKSYSKPIQSDFWCKTWMYSQIVL